MPLLSTAAVIVTITFVVESGLTVTPTGPEHYTDLRQHQKGLLGSKKGLTHVEVWSRNYSPLQLHNRLGQECIPSLQQYVPAQAVDQSADTLRAARLKV